MRDAFLGITNQRPVLAPLLPVFPKEPNQHVVLRGILLWHIRCGCEELFPERSGYNGNLSVPTQRPRFSTCIIRYYLLRA